MDKLLSILILSLPSRSEKLCRLMSELTRQINVGGLEDLVQIIALTDTKEMSVGEKRNKALELACGKYICYVDDDDTVEENYVSLLIQGCNSNMDCVTFCGNYTTNFDSKVYKFKISLMVNNEDVNGWHYRTPNHLCPVKRDIALQVKFPTISYGEDSDYASRLRNLLKNEYHIVQHIYNYEFNINTSQTHPQSKSTAYKENI